MLPYEDLKKKEFSGALQSEALQSEALQLEQVTQRQDLLMECTCLTCFRTL